MLFQVGGFQLPFFVNGSFMFTAIPVLFCVLSRDFGDNSGETPEQEQPSFPIVEALKIPAVMMIGEYIHPYCQSDQQKNYPYINSLSITQFMRISNRISGARFGKENDPSKYKAITKGTVY